MPFFLIYCLSKSVLIIFFSEISYMNICNPNNADSDCVEQGNIINHSQPLVVLENVPIKIRNSKGDQFLLLWTFSKEICLFFHI